ncbi:MAG: DUF45 domain-containing protein, partial [Bacilli bacterium]|nr:DUF45 domain-containing protein [Bacilli bacterium]
MARSRNEIIEFEYNGKTFECECCFKTGIKRLNFKIKNNTLFATVPYLYPSYEVKRYIYSLNDSFLRNLDKPIPKGLNYIYLLGKRYELVRPEEKKFSNQISYINDQDLNKKIKSLAQATYEKEVRKYEQIMGIPKPYKVSVEAMTTRYGTNSRRTNTIRLSLQLIHYNIDVIDSVVIHELSHYFHFDHSKLFYDTVFKY